MILENSGKIVSSYPDLSVVLDGVVAFYTSLSVEYFVVWDPEVL